MQTIILPNNREIKVPEGHVCVAMDKSGEWWSYDSGPRASNIEWMVLEDGDCEPIHELRGPLEPGHWTTQIYWIEG
jgi:hypothetical protein